MDVRSIWLHLRVPFSIYLMPIFWFAVSQSPTIEVWRVGAVLLIVHLFVYPAANAYNSYFDKDEGSVTGIEAPPPVDKNLFWVSLALDALAILLGVFVNGPFVLFVLIYGTVMKAYSYDRIRIKKYPVLSWLVISLLQGGFTYCMMYVAINDLPLSALLQPSVLFGGALATFNILALYPVTQVYQHEEDASRGDMTISRLMGVRGTLVCTLVFFLVSIAGFYLFFDGKWPFYLMLLLLLPAVVFFLRWFPRVLRDPGRADYRSAMRMTKLTGWGMNAFFLILLGLTHSSLIQ